MSYLRNGACFGGTESGSGYFIVVGILLRLRLVKLKLKAVVLLGEVYPHHFSEVFTMSSEKFIACAMRCMSIGIAVAMSDALSLDDRLSLQLELSLLLKKEVDPVDIRKTTGLFHYKVFT